MFKPDPMSHNNMLHFLNDNVSGIATITVPNYSSVASVRMIDSARVHIAMPRATRPKLIILGAPGKSVAAGARLAFARPVTLRTFTPTRMGPNNRLAVANRCLGLVGRIVFTSRMAIPTSRFIDRDHRRVGIVIPSSTRANGFVLSSKTRVPG